MLQHREVSREWRDRGRSQLQRPAAQILSGQVVLACPRRIIAGGKEPTCRLDEYDIATGNWHGTMRSSCAVGFSWLVVARNDAAAQANRSAPNRFTSSPTQRGMCSFCHFFHTNLARSGLQLYQAPGYARLLQVEPLPPGLSARLIIPECVE